jgi:hypothetical protein
VNDHPGIDECLELLVIPPGAEQGRCRTALVAARPRPPPAVLRSWFAAALGDPRVTLAAARAAFLLAGGAARWGGQLLAAQPTADFVRALRAHLPVPVPAELPAPMPCPALSAWAPHRRLVGEPLAGTEGGEP